MISILIPVYNFPVTGLVGELVNQGDKLKKPFEILVLDDCSSDKGISTANKRFCEKHPVIDYFDSETNSGRAEVRNTLAKKAQYEWLLFLDADVFPVHENFLKLYIDSIAGDVSVLSGNIRYRRDVPEEKKGLRWKYGIKYEETSLEEKGGSYSHLKSANLFIKKETFNQNPFPVLKHNYGYEDVLFGLQLQENKINLNLLNNPVYHEGLENNAVFLDKTQEGLKNLAYLIVNENRLVKKIRIVQVYLRLKKYKGDKITARFFIWNKKRIEKNLLSENPNIFLFQFYKLGYLCELLA